MKNVTFGGGLLLGAAIMMAAAVLLWPSTPKPEVQMAAQPYPNASGLFIFIRGTKWTVLFGTEDEMLDLMGFYGQTDCTKKKIYVRGSLDYVNQNDVILHELLHAGTCDEAGKSHNLYYNSTTETDHEGIYKISDFFTILFHDNKDLAKHLYQ